MIPECQSCNSVLMCVAREHPTRGILYHIYCGFDGTIGHGYKSEEQAWESINVSAR